MLWGAFPIVYATLLSAFYLPLILMLAGLILRGVAFEYRHRTERWRWLWDASFAGGSFVAAFMQGLTVGRLVEGLPIANGHYVGGDLGWLSPFAVLCGVGLCIGYSLLGACWLVRKCHGDVREFAYRLIPPLSLALLLFLVAVFGFALIEHLRVMNRWLERPYLFVFPAIGIIAAILLAASLQRRSDQAPFRIVAIVFAAAFGTLALSFWPYMIPFLDHDRGRGRAAFEPGVHVLGRRPLRVPADAALHGDQLQRVQRQDSAGRRSLPLITTEEVPQ